MDTELLSSGLVESTKPMYQDLKAADKPKPMIFHWTQEYEVLRVHVAVLETDVAHVKHLLDKSFHIIAAATESNKQSGNRPNDVSDLCFH